MKNNEEAAKKLILRKFEKIAKLEKEVWEKVNQNNLKAFEKKFVETQIYACVDGFALIRYFNENSNSFLIFAVNERIEIFKSHVPIFSLEKRQYHFPISLGIGGSMTFANVMFGGIDFGAFQIKIESNKNLVNLTEELEEFIMYFEQNHNVEEAKKRIDDLLNQNNGLKNRFNSFSSPLIITEGKTDWRHILRALKHYHLKNNFLNIKPEYFLKYGSKEDLNKKICGCDFEEHVSNSRLDEFLRSSIETRKLDNKTSKSIRIGIFDSDTKNKLYNNIESKIFSFEIVPKNISIEFLYNDSEIKTIVKTRRLYKGLEFNSKSKRHNTENITLGGDSNSTNKAGRNVIIDKDVFNSYHENIGLSKSDFSIAIFNDEITISNESWENFRHIFDMISEILNT